jgi:hypothetical protein
MESNLEQLLSEIAVGTVCIKCKLSLLRLEKFNNDFMQMKQTEGIVAGWSGLYTIGGLDWTGLDWNSRICERSSRTR